MIYKYFPPNEFSLRNLRDGALYFRHYSDFNDPFEFWSKVVEGIPSPSDGDRFWWAMATWGFPKGESDNLADYEDPREYFESLEDEQPPFQLLFDDTRIACFASESTNLLMWAHYAEGMRGFCIGFDESALARLPDAYLLAVDYLDTPPVVDSFVYAVAQDQYDYHMMAIEETQAEIKHLNKLEQLDEIADYRKAADEAFLLMTSIWQRAFAAKPEEWKYENERRLLIRTSEGGTAPILKSYPEGTVREIIVGERMPPSYRACLEKAIEDLPGSVVVRVASRATEHYRIDIR